MLYLSMIPNYIYVSILIELKITRITLKFASILQLPRVGGAIGK